MEKLYDDLMSNKNIFYIWFDIWGGCAIFCLQPNRHQTAVRGAAAVPFSFTGSPSLEPILTPAISELSSKVIMFSLGESSQCVVLMVECCYGPPPVLRGEKCNYCVFWFSQLLLWQRMILYDLLSRKGSELIWCSILLTKPPLKFPLWW